MPAQTELHVDDGTNLTQLSMQCATCDTHPYLERGATEILKTENGDLSEYPFTCPTCSTSVFLRVPHTGGK